MQFSINIDSYYFYLQTDQYDYNSLSSDPVMDFFREYKNPLSSRKAPSVVAQTFPLFPPLNNTIPDEYKVIDSSGPLNLAARVPFKYHHILNELLLIHNPKKIKDWGIVLNKLKNKLWEEGISKDEMDFFNNKYKAVIAGYSFYLRKTKRLNIPIDHRPFLASIGGLTQYTPNYKDSSWTLLRWGQIIFHHFGQDNIQSYGIHISLDIPCSEIELQVIAKNERLKLKKAIYGQTIYYHFTKDRRSRLCIYIKSIKDGGYNPMMRVELVISNSEMKRLGLYSIHHKIDGILSSEKIRTLSAYILKRLNSFDMLYRGEILELPTQKTIETKISKFLYGLHGHSYNPCAYNLIQHNVAESCRALSSFLEVCSAINKQEGGEIELDISLLGGPVLKGKKHLIEKKAKITKETLNNKIIPYMISNYHRISPYRDKKSIENARILAQMEVPNTPLYKYIGNLKIFIDPNVNELFK